MPTCRKCTTQMAQTLQADAEQYAHACTEQCALLLDGAKTARLALCLWLRCDMVASSAGQGGDDAVTANLLRLLRSAKVKLMLGAETSNLKRTAGCKAVINALNDFLDEQHVPTTSRKRPASGLQPSRPKRAKEVQKKFLEGHRVQVRVKYMSKKTTTKKTQKNNGRVIRRLGSSSSRCEASRSGMNKLRLLAS